MLILTSQIVAALAMVVPVDDAFGERLLWADFDGDGLDDLYIARPKAHDVLLHNLGADGFEDVTSRAGLAGRSSSSVRGADFDGDGRIDLLCVGADGKLELLRGLDGGLFEPATESLPMGSAVAWASVEWRDVDRDGRVDLVGVDEGGQTHLWRNAGRSAFEPVVLETSRDPGAPALGAAATGRPPGGGNSLMAACADTLRDQATSSCIEASSAPVLGSLYPLSSDFFVSGSGRVGLGTTSPQAKLHVDGATYLDGNLSFEKATQGLVFPAATGSPGPMITMFASGASLDRMLFAHSAPFDDWGLEYEDVGGDNFVFQRNPTERIFEVSLGDREVRSFEDVRVKDAEIILEEDGVETVVIESDLAGGYGQICLTAPTGASLELDGSNNGTGDPFVAIIGAPNYVRLAGSDEFDAVRANASTQSGVVGTTFGQSSTASGVQGQVASSPVGYQAGVWGENLGTGGLGLGVSGTHHGDGWGVYGRADGPNGIGIWCDGPFVATGLKSFAQPHPEDPSKEIRFVSLEGNESGTYFRGSARLVDGRAVIDVPEDFRLVSEPDQLTVQLTPIGGWVPLWIESKDLDRIVVRGEGEIEFDYFANGIRRGFADLETVRENRHFVPQYEDKPYGTHYPDALRAILVENGILGPDFLPNPQTVAALGWDLENAEEQELERANRQHESREMPASHE